MDRLTETCWLEFSNHIEDLFETAGQLLGAAAISTAPRLPLPYIGGRTFIAGHDPRCLRQRVIAALVAREQFQKTGPNWGRPLPISWDEIGQLENIDNGLLNVLGFFANSMWHAGWDERHPDIAGYAGGLLACKRCPAEIRNDVDVRAMFPPR